MGYQSEPELERELLAKLVSVGYENIQIQDEEALNKNFKIQLEKYNEIELTPKEFENILLHLNKGTIFEKSELLRDKYELKREKGTIYVSFKR